MEVGIAVPIQKQRNPQQTYRLAVEQVLLHLLGRIYRLIAMIRDDQVLQDLNPLNQAFPNVSQVTLNLCRLFLSYRSSIVLLLAMGRQHE
jgi:hypothetical protein